MDSLFEFFLLDEVNVLLPWHGRRTLTENWDTSPVVNDGFAGFSMYCLIFSKCTSVASAACASSWWYKTDA